MADNIITFLGTEPVYFNAERHNVGTIREKALPARLLTYKAFLSIEPPGEVNPFIGQSFGLGSFGLLGGASRFASTVLTGTSPVFYTLDFVQSNPVHNQLIQVRDVDIIDSETINFGAFPLKVGYMLEVTLIDPDAGLRLDNVANVVRDGMSPIAIGGDVNLLPQPQATREDDYFDYYQQWTIPGVLPGLSQIELEKINQFRSYNVYDGKVQTKAGSYTNHRFDSETGTDSNLVKLKDGAVADKIYLVSYDAVTEWLFSEEVNITVRSESFVVGDANVFSSASALNYYINRYTYQSFQEKTDDDAVGGEVLSGWRLTESYKGNINGIVLLNQTRPFDPVENPIVGYKRNPQHVFMNMTEENMRLFTDSERTGYDSGLIETYSQASSESTVSSNPGEGNTNSLTSSDLVTSNNFSTIEIAQRTIADYDADINGSHLLFEPGSAAGIVAQAGEVSFDGTFTSPLFIRNFPRRTRMVLQSAFGVEVLGVVLLSRETGQRFATEDPTYMAAVNGFLTVMNFVDSHYQVSLGYNQTKSAEYRKSQFSSSPHLGQGNDFNPGQPVVLSRYSYQTNIDDTSVTSSPSPKNQIELEEISLSDAQVDSVAQQTSQGILFNIDPNYFIFAIHLTGLASDNNVVTIRGWESTPDSVGSFLTFGDSKPKYEQSGIYIREGGDAIVQVNTWTGVSFIEVVGLNVSGNIDKLEVIDTTDNLVLDDVKSVVVTSDDRGRIIAFYTDEQEALHALTSVDDGKTFNQLTNILMRGDRIEAVSGISNRVTDERYYLFHFYKNMLLMVPFTTSLFCIATEEPDKQTEILDSIRRQYCYLVWGDTTNAEVEDFLITEQEDYLAYISEYPSVRSILDSEELTPTEKDLFTNNKFILYNDVADNDLYSTNPIGQDYAVYQNTKGVIRLIIKTEENFRLLESSDEGQSWRDGWRYIEDSPVENDLSTQVVRINFLSDGVSTEEGSNISLIYDRELDRVFVFYFYEGVLLSKIISDVVLNGDFDSISKNVNELPIYAVAGNLVNVESEQPSEDNEDGNVNFNDFQLDEDNFSTYYSQSIYEDQKVSGYVTEQGYVRLFVQNTQSGGIDTYFYNGRDWLPEHTALNDEG